MSIEGPESGCDVNARHELLRLIYPMHTLDEMESIYIQNGYGSGSVRRDIDWMHKRGTLPYKDERKGRRKHRTDMHKKVKA